jgi:RNA recognition motif-containing protein
MNIFVAKLSSVTKAEDFRNFSANLGRLSPPKVIMDRETGFSKRYGFVEMADDRAGYEAIEKLNNSELDGSQIIVKKSEPKAEKKPFRPRRDFRDRDREPKY